MRRFISIVLIVFFLLVPGLYAEDNNRIVAHVNEDLITLYELNNKIEELTGKTCEELKSSLTEQEFFDIRDKVLDRMISDKLAWEKIKELELVPTKEQIDSYVENIKEHNKWTQEDVVAQLEKEGMTYENFRKELREDLGQRNLVDVQVKEKTVITEEKMLEYYELHKKEYEKPGGVHIASIFLVPGSLGMEIEKTELQEKGKDILERLKKGEDFSDLAREFSNGPGVEDGGDLGNIPLTDIDPKIMEVVDSLKEGEVSSLINMGNRFQIIKLVEKNETAWVPFDEVKDKIGDLLYTNEMEKRYNEYMEGLKKESYIKKTL